MAMRDSERVKDLPTVTAQNVPDYVNASHDIVLGADAVHVPLVRSLDARLVVSTSLMASNFGVWEQYAEQTGLPVLDLEWMRLSCDKVLDLEAVSSDNHVDACPSAETLSRVIGSTVHQGNIIVQSADEIIMAHPFLGLRVTRRLKSYAGENPLSAVMRAARLHVDALCLSATVLDDLSDTEWSYVTYALFERGISLAVYDADPRHVVPFAQQGVSDFVGDDVRELRREVDSLDKDDPRFSFDMTP